MKIKNNLIALLFFASFSLLAQGKKMLEKKEEIYALKVAFITNKLPLTSSEAEKFWPIYNAFEDKQFELKHEKSLVFLKKMDNETLNKMSEKEAAALLSKMESAEEEIFQLRKKLIISLKPILSQVKLIKLRKAEEEFNKKLLLQYMKKVPRNK
ncbi:MAG: sensor of ECF-type sigma factor [Flavobacterium sp.]|nr:sensor of ECF-type sigma factor [Flavobacterium sp.]